MTTHTVGVVVARFQSPYLTEGHHHLIQSVMGQCDRLLIFLGVSVTRNTKCDPLDFATRKAMVLAHYPDAHIEPLHDMGCDHLWSAQLDARITELYPDNVVILFGSRKSFFPSYHGNIETREIKEIFTPSGTDYRLSVSDTPRASDDFRAGVIYGAFNRHPISYQVADVAVIDRLNQRVLLGRKKHDGDKFRFIGGFIDTTDATLECAAKREVIEEVGHIEIDAVTYVTSARVSDWRYAGREDQIMTSFFTADYIFGAPRAQDDLDDVRWFSFAELPNVIIESHKHLCDALLEQVSIEQVA